MNAVRRSFCVLWLLVATPASPQKAPSALAPSLLPSDTLFYLHWRGTSSLESARSTNSLLGLWADPEFRPLQQALIEAFSSGAKKQKQLSSATRAELEQYVSLAENPFLLGFAGPLDLSAISSTPAKESPPTRKPAFFLVYDDTGKSELLAKLRKRSAQASQEPRSITRYAFGSTTVEIIASGKEKSYSARVGSYWIQSNQQRRIEELIVRLRSPAGRAPSLPDTAEYRSAQGQIDDGALLQLLFRMPDLSKLPAPSREGFDTRSFLNGVHLEKLHTITASVSFAGAATRLRMAALGDASPGSLFDLLGESRPTFETLALAPAGTLSFSVTRVNPRALYETVRGALASSLAPDQRGALDMGEATWAGQLGISVPDALGLLRGEIFSMTPTGNLGAGSRLYAATIQKPTEVLRVLRQIFARQITGEEQVGDSTILKFSTSSHSSPARGSERQLYYLAVTPQTLLAAPQIETLREAIGRLGHAHGGTPASLAGEAGFQRARARFPENLGGLSYLDLSRIPWENFAEMFEAGLKKAQQTSAASLGTAQDWIKKIPPAVMHRYLHAWSSGSWKDAHGVYFDAYIE
jgi:hypothetical protein